MNSPLRCLVTGLFLTPALIACSGDDAATAESVAAADATAVEQTKAEPGEPVEITWEQLMPAGEEDRLADLYENYYDELDRKMAADAQRLESAEPGSADAEALVAAIVEGSANDTMEQIGTFNVVESLNGSSIRLPGYVVPFDFSAESSYREFLLVPYFGACLHTPPPPPNQILFVKADPAAKIDDIYDPVWVEGVIRTGEFNSELGDSAYELSLSKVEAYVY